MRTNNLNRKSFVLTGKMDKVRRSIIADILNNNGIYHDKVKWNTDYVVTNSTTLTKKFEAAQRNNIPVITEQDLYRMMNGATNIKSKHLERVSIESNDCIGGFNIIIVD